MLCFTYYNTHGCSRLYLFKRVSDFKWQRVRRILGPICWPIGSPIKEHPCNYYKEGK